MTAGTDRGLRRSSPLSARLAQVSTEAQLLRKLLVLSLRREREAERLARLGEQLSGGK